MKRRGVTLVELMVALACTVFLSAAMLNAYSNAIKVGPALRASEETIETKAAFKDKLTDLLHHVYVLSSGTTTTTTTSAVGGATTVVVTAGAAAAPRTYFTTNPQSSTSGLAQSSGQGQSSGGGSGTSELVFTVLGEPTSHAALEDSSNDFTQQNQARGPEGGVVEYQIGLTPVGSAPNKKGVFIRQQRPADTDPTQGGYEWLLLPDIDSLHFEFWDGTQWQQSWDTTTQTPLRLPAAVRVTYSKGAESPTMFVVRIPLSDATPANPVTNIGGGIAG